MFDMQMARDDNSGYNLALGENYLLHTIFKDYFYEWYGACGYPPAKGIHNLHDELSIRWPDKYIVVTTGAKQALSASIYALNKLTGKVWVSHKAPYWPSMPTLAKLQGLQFSKNPEPSCDIVIEACPNNPDGRINTNVVDILDFVYGSKLYGWESDMVIPKNQVLIESASKLLGMSGLRVGWLVTEDKKIAELASQYVEITTSGTSVASQLLVADILEQMRRLRSYNSVLDINKEAIRSKLLKNGEFFKSYLDFACVDITGLPVNGRGMFSYFKVKDKEKFDKALVNSKVKLVTGEACGGEKDEYRMSMGHLNIFTMEALAELRAEYLKL